MLKVMNENRNTNTEQVRNVVSGELNETMMGMDPIY